MQQTKPQLYTCLSPALLDFYDIDTSIVVIIDVLRAHPPLPLLCIMVQYLLFLLPVLPIAYALENKWVALPPVKEMGK